MTLPATVLALFLWFLPLTFPDTEKARNGNTAEWKQRKQTRRRKKPTCTGTPPTHTHPHYRLPSLGEDCAEAGRIEIRVFILD